MMIKWIGLLLIVVLLYALTAIRDPKLPGHYVQMLSDMMEPVPYESFGENPVLKNGQTLQSPVKGTIARGFTPFPYEATEADAKRAGLELVNPTPDTAETLARGQFVYETFCLHCHGVGGAGDGQLIPRFQNPPDFKTQRLVDAKDGYLFHVVTLGLRNMPSHISQLSTEDRWKVLRYIRVLQGVAHE